MLKQMHLPCAVCAETQIHTQEVPNHALHALLTVFTGIWAIPWIIFAVQDKPAVCGKCGTMRSGKGGQLLLGPGSAGAYATSEELERALDLALQKIKGPLRTCRTKHGIAGEVTFRLRYESSGTIAGVTIDNGPPNITPGFINDSSTIIKGMLVLPPTMTGGVMHFTDLDTERPEPYR